ncbi:30S ribosomal protein S12 methylthiotransferase RimO [Nakamurella leprariae]|uniref:Ribosomal protein uS12 methylthiotransferase RimO n=1 Tax=Nakamurella leprariae TaxID=2803911 RepID=A0A938YCN6_9ACTN|nr:30S ribosomal protein S12 methylthiotransferase RimO [Nakamurella leprariae]MBM9466042.1 30S ribosomal protein S12 methylthiotransferase RimO [Nakamurella leprariae]
MPAASGPSRAARVSVLTLGCARNEVDSSELAGRLHAGGYELVAEDAPADVVVVNTCAFVASAKKDSIDTLLAAADTGAKVVAVGCMAERYGQELADALPEADAVLGFDTYPELAGLVQQVLDGATPESHQPTDRRLRLPLSPVQRPAAADTVVVPGHTLPLADGRTGPTLLRRLLHAGPVAPLKIASGCDRRCTFCAIPSFRGAFVSRPLDDIVAEAAWLAEQGVREVVLVSENSTSFGKDLPGDRHLERLLHHLDGVPGLHRVRLSYLQPAETRPWLLEAIAATPTVADYYDMSFQHADAALLRRMRRFGSRESFLALIDQIRTAAPEAGIRSNVIVGFPGETEQELAELTEFLISARMDTVGVFGYSDEDGTAAADLPGKLPQHVVDERVEAVSSLVEELTGQRAEDRIGTDVDVFVDATDDPGVDDDRSATGWRRVAGRAHHQAPEVDGITWLRLPVDGPGPTPGELIRARVVAAEGVDLVAEPLVAVGAGSATAVVGAGRS